MRELDYSNVSEIKALLQERGLSPTKQRGQNFLINASYRERIKREITSSISVGAEIWEIGPGLGSISDLILKNGMRLMAFELDHGFASFLKDYYGENEMFSLVEGDALKTIFTEIEKQKNTNYKEEVEVICGNLPYNVGTALIADMLEKQVFPRRMVFTLQREVAERLSASPGTPSWGSLSSLRALSYDAHIAFDIPSFAFYPQPKITSSVVVLEKKQSSLIENELYSKFVSLNRALFAQKRKTIRNNLQQYIGKNADDILLKSGVDPSIRPMGLREEDIIKITRTIG